MPLGRSLPPTNQPQRERPRPTIARSDSRRSRPPPLHRAIVAVIEVLLCSDVVTPDRDRRDADCAGLQSPGPRTAQHRLRRRAVARRCRAPGRSDPRLLYAHGERPRDVLLGRRSVVAEGVLGLWLIPITFGHCRWPSSSPSGASRRRCTTSNRIRCRTCCGRRAMRGCSRSGPRVAGGVREEIQRAFLLHRFERLARRPRRRPRRDEHRVRRRALRLQGVDAGIATGLLGAFWGVVYLRRRSSVAPIVSHAGFDLLQSACSILGVK